jgi:hypothetical protein
VSDAISQAGSEGLKCVTREGKDDLARQGSARASLDGEAAGVFRGARGRRAGDPGTAESARPERPAVREPLGVMVAMGVVFLLGFWLIMWGF